MIAFNILLGAFIPTKILLHGALSASVCQASVVFVVKVWNAQRKVPVK